MLEFNPILDTPPTEWRGVAVNTDFRQVLKFFRLIERDDIDDNVKALRSIRLFFEALPEEQGDLWEFLQYYILSGETDNDTSSSGEKLFCFSEDAARVYAAFMQVYNIDLSRVNMHWWTFKALFDGMPEITHLHEVIKIRSWKPSKHDDNKYKSQMRRLKQRYALENSGAESLSSFFAG